MWRFLFTLFVTSCLDSISALILRNWSMSCGNPFCLIDRSMSSSCNKILSKYQSEWHPNHFNILSPLTMGTDDSGSYFFSSACRFMRARNISNTLSNWPVRAHAKIFICLIDTYVVSPSKISRANSGRFCFRANPATNVRLFRNWIWFPLFDILLHKLYAESSASRVFFFLVEK